MTSRNTHDIIFRTVEIGVALWFPCVLWNCIRPEQLWCLNPKKIIESFPPLGEVREAKSKRKDRKAEAGDSAEVDTSDEDGELEFDFTFYGTSKYSRLSVGVTSWLTQNHL